MEKVIDPKYCCAEFEKNATTHQAFAGGGFLYPRGFQPTGQFEEYDGAWSINGCCGGGCYVVNQMKFCPFCGTNLLPTPSMKVD